MADRTTNGSGTALPEPALTGAQARQVYGLMSDLMGRYQFADRAGLAFHSNGLAATGWDRDYYFTLGYKRELEVSDYRAEYQRGGIAERIVEVYPRATWAGGADLVEDPDPGVETPFEAAVGELFDRLDVWAKILRADILAGIGRYSAILIGAPGDLSSELPNLSGPDAILYLKPLAEDRAEIAKFVKDPEDPRFGRPLEYLCKLGDDLQKPVHWTRIIHVAEGTLEDDVFGRPRLRPVWNYLTDLNYKIIGGGSEAMWRTASPRWQLDLDPEMELSDAEQAKLKDETDDFIHGLKSFFRSRGVKVNNLTAAAQAFKTNADAVEQLIAATIGVPHRILVGSERGEQASTQDRDNWNDRKTERRRDFGTPLVGQILGRFIDYGALPEPETWELVWPDSDELAEDEKATVSLNLAKANQAQTLATGEPILTSNEIRDRIWKVEPLEEIEGFDDERPPEEEEPEEEQPVVNRKLRAAKLRLCKQRGLLPQPRAAFDLTDAPPDEPEWKAVHRAADAHRERFARAITRAWSDAAESLELEALTEALETGQEEATQLALAALDDVEARLEEKLPDLIMGVLVAGGEAALRSARSRGSWFRGAAGFRAAAFEASFNQTNPRALQWAEQRSSGLLTEIHPDTVAAIQDLIAQGFREGIPPRALARRIRQTIGLRPDQDLAVANLEAALKAAEPGALIERFPPRAGIRSQAGFRVRVPAGGVTEEWLEQQVARYSRMQLNLRARTIARRETVYSANQGQRELWFQAQESGQLPQDQYRVLITTPDERRREAHELADGQVRRLDEPFDMGDGTTEPGEAVDCRCSQGLATPEDLERAGII